MGGRTEWYVGRQEAIARGGMVAAKTTHAAEVGAAVLRDGGNAVDAAVATAFAAGVVEPWMSGIGGGGFLVAHLPDRDQIVVEFPMLAPAAATPEMFPLAGSGADTALFGWPLVAGGANVAGPRAVALPGAVAGLALALERFGTISLAQALLPAIAFARDGVPVSWHTTLMIARDAAMLSRFPATAAIFLPDGAPPVTIEQAAPTLLRQTDLAATLEGIAADGPRAFYEGPIAEAIGAHLAAEGGLLTADDLRRYAPTITATTTATYAGHVVHTTGGGSGGTTLIESMNLLSAAGTGSLPQNSPEALHTMAQAFRQAFADRFAYLADPDYVEVPVETLIDPAYAIERVARFDAAHLGPVETGLPDRVGIRHGLSTSIPGYATQPNQMADGSTTHLSVIDRHGGAVSLTTTLLSGWGSRVVVPGTGVLLNNGMMWFDPEPGRPNSVGGGKRPLSNMAPAIVTRNGNVVASLGSSGGRRIMNCNSQLVMNLVDHHQSIQGAIEQPRIDASTAELIVSQRLPSATRDALAARGHQIAIRDERLLLGDFASPAGVMATADGRYLGGADPYYFPAAAVGVDTDAR